MGGVAVELGAVAGESESDHERAHRRGAVVEEIERAVHFVGILQPAVDEGVARFAVIAGVSIASAFTRWTSAAAVDRCGRSARRTGFQPVWICLDRLQTCPTAFLRTKRPRLTSKSVAG